MKTVCDGISTLMQNGRTTPVGLTYLVEPRHRKTDNPFYDAIAKAWLIEKIGDIVGFVGAQYGSVVNNQRAREGVETNFEPLPLWHGKGIHLNNFLAEHVETHKQYLKVMPSGTLAEDDSYTVRATVQYRWKDSKQPLNATELATLATFEPTQSTSARQETEKPVFWMIIGTDNILSLRFNRETFEKGE